MCLHTPTSPSAVLGTFPAARTSTTCTSLVYFFLRFPTSSRTSGSDHPSPKYIATDRRAHPRGPGRTEICAKTSSPPLAFLLTFHSSPQRENATLQVSLLSLSLSPCGSVQVLPFIMSLINSLAISRDHGWLAASAVATAFIPYWCVRALLHGCVCARALRKRD